MQANRKRVWWLTTLAIWVLAWTPGCANIRAIVVPVGEPFILLSPIPGPVRALMATPAGEWVEGAVQEIPAGWACWYPAKGEFGEAKP